MRSDPQQRRNRVISLIADIAELELDEVREGHRLREDLGMDSLGSLELLSTLSEELRIDLEIEDAMGIETVGDACEFLERNYLAQTAQPVAQSAER
ncbi:MAG: acyl carrier protein [Myxococcota bacterium]